MANLESLIRRLVDSEALAHGVEEATRQAAVLPALSALGWAWQNLDEVVPEFNVGSGRVDYCLKAGGKSLVFVEVKRTGTELGDHQEQLL